MAGFMEKLRAKYDIYKLQQRYTRREKRTTFTSGAQYIDGEYVYNTSPMRTGGSNSSFGSDSLSFESFAGRDIDYNIALFFMQCHRAIRRSCCAARNAYNPALALRAAFGTTISRKQAASAETSHEKDDGNHVSTQEQDQEQRNADENTKNWAAIARSRVKRAKYRERPVSPQPERTQRTSTIPLWGPEHGRLSSTVADVVHNMAILRENIAIATQIKPERAWDKDWVDPQHLDYRGEEVSPIRQRDFARKTHNKQKMNAASYPWAVVRDEEFERRYSEPRPQNWILEDEIELFGKWIEATPAEKAARQAVIDLMNEVIDKALWNRDVGEVAWEVFGSSKTGLSTPVSDIDIRIWDKEFSGSHKGQSLTISRMHAIERALIRHPYFYRVTYRHGRYPILEARHKGTDIDIQIVGTSDTTSQQEVTAKYLAEIPHLHTVFYIARTCLSMRGLLNVYDGGMGSYGTFVMLVAALKRQTSERKAWDWEMPSVMLYRFLNFYRFLNMEKFGVACFPRPKFVKHDKDPRYAEYAKLAEKRGDPVRAGQWIISQKNQHVPWLLCLQDPANPENDLGRRSHAIKHVKVNFGIISRRLHAQTKRFKSDIEVGKLPEHESVLSAVVGRCHEVYHVKRQKMEIYGSRILTGEIASPSEEYRKSYEIRSLLGPDGKFNENFSGGRRGLKADISRDKEAGEKYAAAVEEVEQTYEEITAANWPAATGNDNGNEGSLSELTEREDAEPFVPTEGEREVSGLKLEQQFAEIEEINDEHFGGWSDGSEARGMKKEKQ